MKILAIESATIAASCAVSEDNAVLGEYTLSHKKTHSEKLMPLIEKLLEDLGINIKEIDAIALSEGPGSFTGLRIGAAIGKSLAYACDIPIVKVPTMKSLAANIYDTGKYIVPVLDAKAGRVYSGIYKWENNSLITVKQQFPTTVEELAGIINRLEAPVLLNGDGSAIYKSTFESMLKIKPVFSTNQFNYLRASSLAFIGYEMAKKGETVSASEFSPDYLRLSQAERNTR